MTLDPSNFQEQNAFGSSCGGLPNSYEADPTLSMRTLEMHEASFALQYLRAACRGVIPNSLRHRIGESDLIQDALLKASQSIGQFRGSTVDSFKSWLRGIYQSRLKNLIRTHITSQKRSVRREELLVEEATVHDSSYSETLTVNETALIEMQIMNQTFQQLSASDQQIVELHSRRGLAFDQVASLMGVSEIVVRKRFTRAIHRWRKLVQKASRNRL